jgi:methyltransferase-like protein 6
VLDIGCGVGNTAYPLMEKNAEVVMRCGDFSQQAVDEFRARPRYD